ncbi:MAG: hypothetical protein AB8C84_10940 [Oligoflexales bacterium]
MVFRFFKFAVALSCASNAFAVYDQNWVRQCEQVVKTSQEDPRFGNSSDSTRALFVWLGRYYAKDDGLKSFLYHSFYNPDIKFFHGLSKTLNCQKVADKLNEKNIDLGEITDFKISNIMDHTSLRRMRVLNQAYGETLGREYHLTIVGKNSGDKGSLVSASQFDLALLPFFFPGIKKLDIDHATYNETALPRMNNLKSIYFKNPPHQKLHDKVAIEVLKATKIATQLDRISFESVDDHQLDYDALGIWLSASKTRRITFPLVKDNESAATTERNIKDFLDSIALYSAASLQDYEKLLNQPKLSEKSHMTINMKNFKKYVNVTRLQILRKE